MNVMKAYGNTPGSFPTAVNYYLQTREYLLPYINPIEWNMYAPKSYKGYAYSDSNSPLKTLEDFSQLLYDNLYKGPAFVDLLFEDSVDGHAVTIWGATFKDGRVTSVYISDSDDNETTYKAYTVTCTNNRLRLEGHWAPRINALTFLWLPSGVTPVPPPETEPEPEAPTETVVKLRNGHEVRVPHTWVKEHFPACTDFTTQLEGDSDGDGFTDAEEYFIGTNPTLKSDRLKIEAITFDANGKPIFTIFPATPGDSATFILYGCETLNGTWKKHEDSDTTHRFFRIRVEPK
ncbi:MAG: thrombospondin type 3 repeat-containing protein [bacterium]|nr:thrombospondin type 3 repeat-containing protein [bacterium]